MKKIKYKYSYGTDIGRRRERNEDRLVICPEYHFYGVSDGMGGLYYGEETAQMTCDAMKIVAGAVWNYYKEAGDVWGAGEMLKEELEKLSNHIYSNGNEGDKPVYGATFCGAMVLGSRIIVVNIGDSRGYYVSKNCKKQAQITTDHNMAEYVVRQGIMTAEEAAKTNLDARLYSFVGISDHSKADVFIKDIKDGYRLLICSDGLYKMLTNDEITVHMKNTKDLGKCCNRLIRNANRQGGRDNITLACLEFTVC